MVDFTDLENGSPIYVLCIFLRQFKTALLISLTFTLTNCGAESNLDDEQVITTLECNEKDLCAAEHEIYELLNQKRLELGLSTLQNADSLKYGARHWSELQLNQGSLSHAGFPELRTEQIRIGFADFDNLLSAENVASSTISDEDQAVIGQHFFTMWLNSPGHKANMLGDHKAIGIGLVKKGSYIYATQLFYD